MAKEPDSAVRLTKTLELGQPDRVVVFIHGHNCTADEAQATLETMIGSMAATWDAAVQARTEFLCLSWDARCNTTLLPSALEACLASTSAALLAKFTSGVRHLFEIVRGALTSMALAVVGLLWVWLAWIAAALAALAISILGLLRYRDGLDRVAQAFRGLTLLLNDISLSGRELHIIAHSMGCQAVMAYLDRVAHKYRTLTTPYYGVEGEKPGRVIRAILKTVSLIAPHVHVAQFRLSVRYSMSYIWVCGGFWRLMVVSNTWDFAIWASKSLRLFSSRIGIPNDAVFVLNEAPRVSSPDSTVQVIDTSTFFMTGHDIWTDCERHRRRTDTGSRTSCAISRRYRSLHYHLLIPG